MKLTAYSVLLVFPFISTAIAQTQGNIENGQRLYESRCIGCHSIDTNRVGPAHQGVFGRKAGSVDDYVYSSAVKNSQIVWTTENLDEWLLNPEGLIPGQKMGYSISDPKERDDLIAFLKTVE